MIQPDSAIWKALEFYGTRVRHRGKYRLHNWLLGKLGVSCDRNFEVERLGLRWLLNPSDFVQAPFYWTGEFESWDSYHFSRFITPGAFICDVGANFGFYTIMAAHQLRNSGGRVFAFEPCGETIQRLQTNIRLNGLEMTASVVPTALSEKQGVGFLDQEENQILAAAQSATRNSGARFLSQSGERITLDTLDNVVQEFEMPRVDLIKIDVEGYELSVLNGASATIQRFKPRIMVEFNPMALQRAGASAAALQSKLQAWGYRLFEPKRRVLAPLSAAPQAGAIVNVFALPA